MNLPKLIVSTCFACLTGLLSSSVFATVPSGLQALNDAELSQVNLEHNILADRAEQRALRHRVYEIEQELQHFTNNGQRLANVDWKPRTKSDDLPHLSPALRAHVENIAKGLQSDDPRRGLKIMIDGFEGGIHLENISFSLLGMGMMPLPTMQIDQNQQRQIYKSGVSEHNRNLVPEARY